MSASPRLIRQWIVAVTLALVVPTTGCGSGRTVTLAQLQAERDARQAAYEAGRADFVARLAERVVARGDRTLDVLVLSGGGQHGAYGAGFLRGWRERPTEAMPRFDVVTGISTGALLSPFAFVGTPEALARASELYRNPSDIRPRLYLNPFRPRGGLFSTQKLDATLDRTLDAEMVGALRAGFDEGRLLLVGTTDLDLGRGRVWDVSHELDGTPEGLERYRRILLASTAIPGVFPPVELDGRLHTDGGIATTLLTADLEAFRALAAELRRQGAAGPVNVRVWALVNLWLQPPPQVVRGTRVQAVSTRSTGLLLGLNQQQTLVRLWEISQAVNSGVEGLRMQLRYTAVPDSFAAFPGALGLFDEAYMRRLEAFGYEQALRPDPWLPLPPGPFE